MMIDPFDLWQSFQSTVNTYVGGWFRPQSDFIVKANDISKQLWNKWTREAEKSQEARDNLIYLMKSANVIVKSQNSYYGIVTPPKDYARFASARLLVSDDKTYPDPNVNNGHCDGMESNEERTQAYYDTIEERTITLVDTQRWGACLSHATKKPSLENPKMNQIDNQFKVAPRQVSVVVLDYYVEPPKAVFAYTMAPGDINTGAGDQIIYNQSLSKPLPWPDTLRNEFISYLGEAYNVFTRQEFWAQFSNKQKQES